ncbi:GBGT1 acetylgalactosaminyltransferase, partial [Chaetops frenatus]|nr:GBGT1 acetylgalactosaminyltransferase [Chaetops frenatus]
RRQDVLTVTPWLAPMVWEGTFNPEILDSAYRPLNLTIGVAAFAVGNFVRRFLESAEQHFTRGYRVNYYIFTDSAEALVLAVPIQKHPSWQEVALRRMEAISQLVAPAGRREVQYLFCLDIAMVFLSPWGPEALGDVVAAIHPGYLERPRSQFPYERRSSSAAFVPEGEGDFYYGAAVFGGSVRRVYEFTRSCHMAILADKANGIVAVRLEESHLSRHFLSHKPSKLLSPEYLWHDGKPKPPEIRLIRFSTVEKDYKELQN